MADVSDCVEEYRLCCQPSVSLMKIGMQALSGGQTEDNNTTRCCVVVGKLSSRCEAVP